MSIVYAVNSQPKQLTSDESRYLRHQLQDVRDRINQLLDNMDCHGLLSVVDAADSKMDGTAGTGHTASTTSASNTAASFDALTSQKYTRDGTTAGSVDAGELPADIIGCLVQILLDI